MDSRRQNDQLELAFTTTGSGEARAERGEGAELSTVERATESPAKGEQLMEEICERENLKGALQRVKANKGSPGIDGMTVGQLPEYLKEHWPEIRERLLKGAYKPQPVKRVETLAFVPNPEAGRRGAQVGHSDGAGQIGSASGESGLAAAVGPDIFRTQLRVPTGTVGTSGSGSGAAVRRRGLRLGGRS
jgi:hypothetical protein